MKEVCIVDVLRTPRCRVTREGGALSAVRPVELVATLLRELSRRIPGIENSVRDVVLGCSTASGEQGANVAKTSVQWAGWPDAVPGLTVSRYCTSGLDAIHTASARIQCGADDVLIAGGVESMSRVPMFSDRGPWFADPVVSAQARYVHMGIAADVVAALDERSRPELDEYALRSQQLAAASRVEQRAGITPVNANGVLVADDDAPRGGASAGSLAALPAIFAGKQYDEFRERALTEFALTSVPAVHTVGHAPAIVDGASLVLLCSREFARERGLGVRAQVRGFATASAHPVSMLTAHVDATRRLCSRSGLALEDVHVYEVNESFAASVLHYRDALGISGVRMNPSGGAIALGHPLGATGGVLAGRLVEQLEARGGGTGIAAIPAGAGLGAATAIHVPAEGCSPPSSPGRR